MKNIALLFYTLFLFACGGDSNYVEPDFYFEGEFEPLLVNGLEIYLTKLADDKNLRIFEKDRDQMKILTQDKDALYISLYNGEEEKPVLWVTNVGAGTVLTLGLLANETFSLKDTKALSEMVVGYLKTELNIEMKPVSPHAENK